jgi:hypothetical protein
MLKEGLGGRNGPGPLVRCSIMLVSQAWRKRNNQESARSASTVCGGTLGAVLNRMTKEATTLDW